MTFTRAVGVRVAVLLVGWLAVLTIGIDKRRETFVVSNSQLFNLPARWDSGWYVAIAANGYFWDKDDPAQQTVAFFPALPVLMGLWPHDQVERLWFGCLWMIVAFAIACRLMLRLAELDLPPPRAHAATALLAAWPFAIYYSVPYTESLFLLGAVGAFYYLRTNRVWLSAMCGLLCGFSRPNGCLLALPLLAATWQWARSTPASSRVAAIQRALPAIVAPGIGVVAVFAVF
jgi:Gpi18-like mannosyltransferase